MSTLTFFLRREKNTHPSSSFGNKSYFPDNVCSALSSRSYLPGCVSLSCLCLDKYKIRRSLYTHKIMRSLVNNSRLLFSNIIVFQICLLELVEAKINEFLLFSVTESWGPANGFRLCCHLKIVLNCLKWCPYGELFIYCFKHFLNNAAQRTAESLKFKKVGFI